MSETYPLHSIRWRPTIGGVRVNVLVQVKDYGDKITLVSCRQLDKPRQLRRPEALHAWAMHWLLDNQGVARSIMQRNDL